MSRAALANVDGLLDGGDSRVHRLGAASNLSGKQTALSFFGSISVHPGCDDSG
ncbi:hypothetical protein K788_0007220 [Paraburkholderia caribensis MBA4]|uniref:Uncharacterized protein n=1 Tax=Paraburkholderia caribensis MBA4 TaxID=1323664 RepID=A0A0N7JTJ1_9BURK|nr:hypothetical protein K788_0007220 [Paraburkholderia caribensis MBA4]